MDKFTIYTIYSESPPPPPDRITIYSNGFLPEDVTSDILVDYLLNRMPTHRLHTNVEDNEISLVESGYKKYRVQLIKGSTRTYEHPSIESANRQFYKLCSDHPDKLVELFTLDWDNNILDVRWYKKFKYNMKIKSK